MTLTHLFYGFIFILAAYALIQHANMSSVARAHARKHCETMGVQLLDQNIILRKLSLHGSRHSLIAIGRLYLFEFSSIGDTRYHGTIKLIGNKVITIELEPFKSVYQGNDNNSLGEP
jgi:hypothetical protein